MIKKTLLIIACIVSIPTFTVEFAPINQNNDTISFDLIEIAQKKLTQLKKDIIAFIASSTIRYNQTKK